MSSESAPAEPTQADTEEPAKEKGLAHYLGLGVSIALLLLIVALAVILIVVPKVSGSVPLTVLTGSMKPGLPPGTLIIVQPVEVDDIGVGDVITYQIRSGEPDVITHRVIGFTDGQDGDRRFILQGDNNAEPDPDPIRAEQVQGRLWYSVPYVGFVNTVVNGENRAWIVAVIAGLFLSYAAYMIVSGVVGAVKKSAVKKRTASGDSA